MRPLAETPSWVLAELGYELCEFTHTWQVLLAWNFAVAGVMAAGFALGQRDTLAIAEQVFADLRRR